MHTWQLIIFDLDGTILDTLEDLTDSVNYVLVKNNFPQRSIDEIRNFVGNGILKLIERALPNTCDAEILDKAFGEFKEYYQEHCHCKTKPYAGMPELLSKLRSLGIKLAVVSNKNDSAVKELCRVFYPNLFDLILGASERFPRKPAPEIVLYVMDKFQIDKVHTLYVGDSEVDVEAAKNAEVTCCSVTWGFKDKAFLQSKGAKVFADNVLELEKVCLA